MIAYLDTNVFDHLYGKVGCTSNDIANLRKAIYGRELAIPLSIHTLEEILLAHNARPELLVARIKLTLSLASFRRLVKPCDQLLADDIRAYAARGEADRPYLGADKQNTISSGIAELIETDGEDLDEEMVAALEEARRRKERFIAGMRTAHGDLSCALDNPGPQGAFDQYFREVASKVAESFASRLGVLDQCAERGLDGLLELKSVRMTIGGACSLAFERSPGGAAAAPGDLIDLHHAASAAAVADTFVTDDARLRRALTLVPFEKFEVLDLPQFLRRFA